MLMNMDTITNRLVRRFILFPPFGKVMAIINAHITHENHSAASAMMDLVASSGVACLALSKVRARSGASLRFGGLVSGRAHNEP